MTIVEGAVYESGIVHPLQESLDISQKEIFDVMDTEDQKRLLEEASELDTNNNFSYDGEVAPERVDLEDVELWTDEAMHAKGELMTIKAVLEERDQEYIYVNNGIDVTVVEVAE